MPHSLNQIVVTGTVHGITATAGSVGAVGTFILDLMGISVAQ